MGDMNAKIESNNEGSEHVMGRHGIGNMTENGELFSELCARCQAKKSQIARYRSNTSRTD